jgi:hypothetical protein
VSTGDKKRAHPTGALFLCGDGYYFQGFSV